ncbi:dienelactone hydrolase family protein [Flavobacterium sp. IMCC34852]|uniref:Dienelactone hydrolase family protein n=1 Tax=Flavobacterium rivulicola TaxID=2732161 RepID=A0A7Y3RBT3_9FLAO|nr:dienelactone hydrolase family protein [Flavobacterium sp. IMCC34852]NNT73057.1 dienelactone hydrolase family protein [Flavobacterium sp. IMCC34852]
MKLKTIIMAIVLSLSFNSFAQLTAVDYKDGEQVLSGFGIKPKSESKDKPGVLVLPAWFGIDAHSQESASKLAELGYYSFVADIYGKDNRPKNSAEAGKNAGYYKKNYAEYQKRIQLALDQLVKMGANPDKIVVMGYCFGGTGAIEAARANLKVQGVVSFHGGLGKDITRAVGKINPKVLVLHGADDPFVPKEEVDAFQSEMRASGADWQMVYYANSVHAFTHKDAGSDNSKGAAYNELADKRSWIALKDFLKEVL